MTFVRKVEAALLRRADVLLRRCGRVQRRRATQGPCWENGLLSEAKRWGCDVQHFVSKVETALLRIAGVLLRRCGRVQRQRATQGPCWENGLLSEAKRWGCDVQHFVSKVETALLRRGALLRKWRTMVGQWLASLLIDQ